MYETHNAVHVIVEKITANLNLKQYFYGGVVSPSTKHDISRSKPGK